MSIREALESAGAEIGMTNGVPTPEEKAPEVEPEEVETEAEGEETEQPEDAEPKEAAQTKSPEPKAETQPKAAEEPKAPEQAVEQVQPPQFWKAEHRALWSKAPVEVQKAFLEYETQRNAWANRLANEVAGVRQQQKQLDSVFEPHIPRLKAAGLHPVEAVDKLLRWSDILDDESTRIQGFNRLLASYGLTPEHLTGQEQEQIDPQYSQLNTELSQLKEWKEGLEAKSQEHERQLSERQLQNEIAQIRETKDEKGNSKFPHFDFFAPHMAQIIPQLKAENPLASNADVIRVAYERVAGQFPQFSQPTQQPIQAPQEKQRIERAQRAAKINVSTKPTIEVNSRPKNAREALLEAAGELGLR